MAVPSSFIFSQSSLQDYADCPRRFQLRYLKNQKWPAVQSEPVLEQEQHMQQGNRFHQLVQQHQMGLPMNYLTPMITDPDLSDWWQNYLDCPPENLPVRRYPEFTLTASFAGYRVLAKYDLLAVEPGERAVIVDWKTTRHTQKQAYLQERLQTRLYPMLAVLAGMSVNRGQPVLPEQVEMIYWFAVEPHKPVHIRYSEEQFLLDQKEVFTTIREIAACADPVFEQSNREKSCQYCCYRSLCGRGEQAGILSAEDDDPADGLSRFDFDQIGELRF